MAKNKYYILALVLAILAVVLFFVTTQDRKNKKSNSHEISSSKNKALDTIQKDVNSENVVSKKESSVSFSIEPEFEEKVSFKISGKLESFSWKKGDSFKKGDLLFQLDNSLLFEQIIEAKKQLKIDLEENLKTITNDEVKSIWLDFYNHIQENDLLPPTPKWNTGNQVKNEIKVAGRHIEKLEREVFDYFYLAPFDGEFKGFNVGTDKIIKEKENFATIYPTEYAIIKGEIDENSLVFYKKNGIIDQRESFVKSRRQSNGKVLIFKKIKKSKLPTYPFYSFYVIMP